MSGVNDVVYGKSVFDEESEDEELISQAPGIHALSPAQPEGGDKLHYDGPEILELEPGDGAWIPVKRMNYKIARRKLQERVAGVSAATAGPERLAPDAAESESESSESTREPDTEVEVVLQSMQSMS